MAIGADNERYEQRISTVASLLRNLTSIVVGVVVVLTFMAVFDIPLAPLLASAGVGGIALAFGAQSLVKDFLSGIFMIMEDQYGVGDLIDTGEVRGTVEEVGLRVTRVRDATGTVWYVRNGEILKLGNQSQGWSTAIIDVPVAYDEDAGKVMGILEEVATEIDARPGVRGHPAGEADGRRRERRDRNHHEHPDDGEDRAQPALGTAAHAAGAQPEGPRQGRGTQPVTEPRRTAHLSRRVRLALPIRRYRPT